jgi:hypothetical protein
VRVRVRVRVRVKVRVRVRVEVGFDLAPHFDALLAGLNALVIVLLLEPGEAQG